MHIAVDARFLTHPQAGGFRTYTRELCAVLVRVGTECRFTFYVDREPSHADDVPAGENVTVRVVGGTPPFLGMPVREQKGLRLAAWRDRPDILHSLCNTAPARLPCPLVVTLHDTLWDVPFAGAGFARNVLHAYTRRVAQNAAQYAAAICVPSEYVQGCVTRELAVDAARVFVTPEAAGAVFTAEERPPRPPKFGGRKHHEAFPAPHSALSERWNAPHLVEHLPPKLGGLGGQASRLTGYGEKPSETYALALGSADGRKNLPLLARAWANLPDGVKQTHTLVTVWANTQAGTDFARLCERLGMAESSVILPAVTDAELAALYRDADVFLFPSRAEGFGLPALEAFACGCPVICSNSTSLPEVCGDAALLLDPDDVDGWTRAIVSVLSDAALRDDLRERGRRRAGLFSWDECARRTLSAYEFARG